MTHIASPSSNSPTPTHHTNRVSIIGAGKVGSTLAQRIVEKNIADVVLLDIIPGIPQGIALDLNQARGVELHDRVIIGTNSYTDTAASDIVVITAGKPRKPGMSRSDLAVTNAPIVMEAAKKAIAQSPNAIFIVVSNPLDVMTYLAWEASGLPSHRIMGMAGVLDSSRFQSFIAAELNVSITDVKALVLGDHGNLMVPLPRYCTVRGIPVTELLDAETIQGLTERTRHGGQEIVEHMKTGSAYFAPASAVSEMVAAILQDKKRILPAAAYLQGEYDIEDVFLGVPCSLGCQGVEKIVKLDLTSEELDALQSAAMAVKDNVSRAKKALAAGDESPQLLDNG
ncbi:malate dehydrogenase [Geitlerinema sp. PCC 9228]|jgi:malate dehydrogenase|uniref:malate dehydrogenase n=1 Tax=Geitlerinema sp. PCC 9228 TaxID=111611 RepID=UPI0008F9AEFA|nr:malate dehydrogenase [Geitlerinema sp. PCC 9228]